jgi:hypothetical protein
MTLAESLPETVAEALRATPFAEFATLNAQGVPIDTPLLSFPDEDLATITMATGLAYPAKAERARRNPKVGLLYYPTAPGDPVVQVVGLAATRDRDIQANLLRYLAETIPVAPETPWAMKRQAIWYWSRILIEIRPKQILWWKSAEALDQAPERWDAPAAAAYPPSDPAPSGKATPAPHWPPPAWREAAEIDVAANYPAYLSLVDDDGFPRVMRARDVRLTDDGLSLDLPAAAPGRRTGPASLTYFGRDTFVGALSEAGGRLSLRVERTLPILPLVGEGGGAFDPAPDVKAQLMARLQAELDRRGQPLPVMPQDPPEPTSGAQRRADRDTRGADAKMFERRTAGR